MLTAILFALMGIGLGQFIKIEIDPRLLAFFDDSLTQARTTVTPIAQSALGQIKTTVQKQVKRTKPDPQIQADLDLVEARFLQP